MKLESLVIANQNVAVNTFPGLVHTARHTMGVGNARSRWPNRKEGAVEGEASDPTAKRELSKAGLITGVKS